MFASDGVYLSTPPSDITVIISCNAVETLLVFMGITIYMFAIYVVFNLLTVIIKSPSED